MSSTATVAARRVRVWDSLTGGAGRERRYQEPDTLGGAASINTDSSTNFVCYLASQ